ncbi:MAG: hypothetical protein CVU14_08200 [Bacteroidetes bacterium HGW-Bacteroidetes-9]|jgi:tRNA nucleotidyltransferase/poly(A) polymerase|nr:MAG: hypothetical protein CVU14_08200 [Bacteroidetes bacterium HGW-Bacteroidetes-9]
MPHWLEEAEKSHHPEKSFLSRAERINQRYQNIQANYAKNDQQYDEFMRDLHGLIHRVNKLPASRRVPFGKMDGREKESKLNNHLNIFSSSKRLKRKKFWGFIPFFDSDHLKHIRVIFMNVSDEEGMIEIELKENILQREAIKSDKSNRKDKSENPDRLHVIYNYPISGLDHETALEIIDWLAFSKEISACSFYTSVSDKQKHFT